MISSIYFRIKWFEIHKKTFYDGTVGVHKMKRSESVRSAFNTFLTIKTLQTLSRTLFPRFQMCSLLYTLLIPTFNRLKCDTL